MKRFLSIAVCLVLLFLNVSIIANAAPDIAALTITMSQTKVKTGDTIKFEIQEVATSQVLENSAENLMVIRSRLDAAEATTLQPNYNNSTKKYELEYTIPSNMLKGEWYIEKVVLQDITGSRTYSDINSTFTVNPIVSFNSNGGGKVAEVTVEYNGKAVAPINPIKAGYTFRGWYKDNTTFANLFDFNNTQIIENIQLFAKWIINNYTVSFNSQGGSAVKSMKADYNSAIKAPLAPTRTGYIFGGWYKEAGCINTWNFGAGKVKANTMLYSKWIVTMPAPTLVKASSSSYNSINISWRGVTGATLYGIYRSTSSAGTYTLITTTRSTIYNNTGLATNSNYYYKIRSYRIIDKVNIFSGLSAFASSKAIPSAPINVKATRISSKSIKLTWNAVTGANGYDIYVSTLSTGVYRVLASTSYLYYTNSGLISGKIYYYKIRSYRTIGKTRVYSNLTVAAYRKTTNIVFNNLVQANVVYGKYLGLKVEILDQYKYVFSIRKANGSSTWVPTRSVSVALNPVTNTRYLGKNQLETYVNTTSTFVSNTNYFTWVDLDRQRVNIFTGSSGHWVLYKTYSCATGNNTTPSKRGLFTVQDKGYSFVSGGALVKYWTRYSGNYLLHSILLTHSGGIYDATLGTRASHGCIRMPLDMAKWYFEKMPKGSLIWVN